MGETITELTYGATTDEEGRDYVAQHSDILDFSKKTFAGYFVDLLPLRMYTYRGC